MPTEKIKKPPEEKKKKNTKREKETKAILNIDSEAKSTK